METSRGRTCAKSCRLLRQQRSAWLARRLQHRRRPAVPGRRQKQPKRRWRWQPGGSLPSLAGGLGFRVRRIQFTDKRVHTHSCLVRPTGAPQTPSDCLLQEACGRNRGGAGAGCRRRTPSRGPGGPGAGSRVTARGPAAAAGPAVPGAADAARGRAAARSGGVDAGAQRAAGAAGGEWVLGCLACPRVRPYQGVGIQLLALGHAGWWLQEISSFSHLRTLPTAWIG